ncbi:MAG: YihY family inner membrane protein [Motiliproteus sp.]|nr:YihY family inner membrane protein [Motiliproteus sp.]MCW9053576.1 YihY family inner membrane protein [Motiliproteus sp.]
MDSASEQQSQPQDAAWTALALRFLKELVQGFKDNRGTLSAAALTYTTLFAVVPLMTVTYSVLASVPSFQGMGQQLEAFIFSHFIPSSGVAVRDYLSQFATQARALTMVGIGFLVITAFMMMKTIEAAFNRIWHVRSPRKGVSSFLLYWAVLSLGPLLVGLGFALTSYLTSLPMISDAADLLGKRFQLLSLLPLFSSGVAFTLIYLAVPNCRVSFKHAAIGGFSAALIFELAKQGFALFVTQFPSYELIYGAFAAVPLFLAWIYISWLIILLGAELVHTLGTFNPRAADDCDQEMDWVLLMLEQLWLAQKQGRSLSVIELQAGLQKLSRGQFDRYLNHFLEQQLIKRTESDSYLLCRDLHLLSLAELCNLMPFKIPASTALSDQRDWGKSLQKRLETAAMCHQQRLAIDLASLFAIEGGSSDETQDIEYPMDRRI